MSHIVPKGSIVALSEEQYKEMAMNSETYNKNGQVGQGCAVNFCGERL